VASWGTVEDGGSDRQGRCLAAQADWFGRSLSGYVDIAERVLNHVRERIEATYDVHEYLDEKRDALERWEKYLAELRDSALSPKEQNRVS
jgi:hypothetical protein